MASITEQTVHAGHTISITYNGKAIGKIQSIEGSRQFGTQGVYEIGSIMPQEHVELKYEGSLTVDRYFVRNQDLQSLGLAALGRDVLTLGILNIVVTDKYLNNIEVRTYHGCTMQSDKESFRVNSIAGENATFQYLYTTDANVSPALANNLN